MATLPGPLVRKKIRKEALSLPSLYSIAAIWALLRLKARKIHCGFGSEHVNIQSNSSIFEYGFPMYSPSVSILLGGGLFYSKPKVSS